MLEGRSGRSLDLPRTPSPFNPAAQTGKVSPANPATPNPSTTANGKAGLKVLVADDNSTNLEVLTRMLLLEKVHNVEVVMVSHFRRL